MFTVYIIYSTAFDKFYVGHTHDLKDRLFRHNNSGNKATKNATDWIIKHTESFETRALAAARNYK